MQKKKVIIMHPGESRTAVITIHSIKNEKFTIESAEYSLIYMKDKAEESTGVCNIKEHDIEALISPQKRRSEGGMMAAEIIEIKSVSLSPNPVQTGGKVKISVGLEVNESDVNCFYCIFSSELETSQVTTTATV